MEQSYFMDRDHPPGSIDLQKVLGRSSALWEELKDFILEHCPGTSPDWDFTKYGWNCRIKDKKRTIIYLMPFEHSFRASLVLGRKAVNEALSYSSVSPEVKTIISTAKSYAEGTGIRINVKTKKILMDVKTLTALKFK